MIEYRTNAVGIEPRHLDGFFVGWAQAPRPGMHLRILEGSDHIVLAFDSEADRVVGFITAITDGVLTAYIPYLEVLPDWQDRGIGLELTRRMIDEQLKGFYAVDLMCDPGLQSFYGRFRMLPVFGMMRRRYEYQPGPVALRREASTAAKAGLLAKLAGFFRKKA